MNLRAVVFDLDGTLVNSLTDIARAANSVLAAHGFPTYDVQSYRYFVGNGVRALLDRIVPSDYRQDERLAAELLAEFMDRYRQTWNVESHLYDGVTELLDQLVRRDVQLAVLSNKPQAATSECVAYYLSGYPFAAVLGQTENRPPKPDQTGIREVLDRLQVTPTSCLYLGDTAVDIQTAESAQMISVGATWGFRDREELEQAGADIIIDHPLELLEAADSLYTNSEKG